MNRFFLAATVAVLGLAPTLPAAAQSAGLPRAGVPAPPIIHYREETIDGVKVFYREAGPKDGPVVLLLHGFPTSSHMFRNLIPLLADKYRVIAPDYPGFGQSDAPDHTKFAYSFGHYADIVDALVQRLGASRYAMYVMDYGAPVGYRLALKHPERVSALIIQNGNAYEEGLREFWDPIKAYWREDTPARRAAMAQMVKPETTRFQYTDGMGDVSRISPDNWVIDQALLDRPGNNEIQYDLFYDYRTNVPLYPQFQQFFRTRKPPTLIVWGKNDRIFPAEGAFPYRRDLPDAEFHLVDSGHFALEDRLAEMAPLIRDFLDRKIASR
ncbi:alpha/beta hydrolase [Sphingomonas sp. AP4-R1]|uniref:alpha/beta fold hydrolase n=1 Tax=Sphingomonas sp. AP4-R1 TaxID=2735134 RepID=UPI0014939878|nr:alpha/beta hydrolase [Sphingomonas sp. AP4-R1]QJU60144.1 alpha/beta hydrolase [Sphingomonas sp. AP4-R1]